MKFKVKNKNISFKELIWKCEFVSYEKINKRIIKIDFIYEHYTIRFSYRLDDTFKLLFIIDNLMNLIVAQYESDDNVKEIENMIEKNYPELLL